MAEDLESGVQALGIVEEPDEVKGLTPLEDSDKAEEVAVNGRFGLVAIGTIGYVCSMDRADSHRGKVHLISLPPYPQLPRSSHTFDLALSANLRKSTLALVQDLDATS